MTITPEQLVVIIGAIGVVLVNVITAWRANVKQNTTEKKVDATLRQNDQLIQKTVQIHEATNGNLSRATAALEVAKATIAGLETLVAALMAEKRDALAVATASATAAAAAKKDAQV